MSLESATYLTDLVSSNPTGSDNASQGDDHIRLIKAVLQTTLPNASRPKYLGSSGATKTSSFSTANTDDEKAFQCDATSGAITVTLFTTTIDGLIFYFQKIDSSSNAVVLDPTSTVLINGASTLSLTKQWQGCKVIWLNTYGAWLCLPAGPAAIPYYSGGQDIPFTDIAPSANAKRILGAATATDFSEQTIATVLEWLGTAARGDIILRGASAFAFKNLGTSGQFLKSDGTDLVYGLPLVPARATATYATNTSLTANIPADDTIPQVGEGTEILSASITPIKSTSLLRVTFMGSGGTVSGADLIAALFKDGAANAVAAAFVRPPAPNLPGLISLEYTVSTGSTSAVTFSIRVGAAATNSYMNGTGVATRVLGGASFSTLICEELFTA